MHQLLALFLLKQAVTSLQVFMLILIDWRTWKNAWYIPIHFCAFSIISELHIFVRILSSCIVCSQGNTKAASEIYETAIEDAIQKQNIELLQDLYNNFARFIYAVRTKYLVTDIKYAMPFQFKSASFQQVSCEMKCADCRIFVIWQTCIPCVQWSEIRFIYMHDQCVVTSVSSPIVWCMKLLTSVQCMHYQYFCSFVQYMHYQILMRVTRSVSASMMICRKLSNC